MAFSKSLQKGQIGLSCQMCKESSEIKWKCLTCQSFMCSKCCKIHRKLKFSDKHDIMDIKGIALHSAESGTTPDFTNINCSHHKDQKCCLYCKVCEAVVCPMCMAKVHNTCTHKMVKISEGYQVSLSKIQNMNSEVEGDILKFTSDVSKLDSIRSAERSRFTKEKEKILNHEKAVKDAVVKQTKKLLTDLDQRWQILQSTFKGEETYAVKVIKDLETENKAVTQAMDSNNASEVFKIASEGRKLKRQSLKPVNIKYQRLPKFVPGKINSSSVESIHGTLGEIKEQNLVQKVQIQVKEQYTTTYQFVNALVCCDDGSVWTSDTIKQIVQNVKLSHGSVHVNETINLRCADMALTPSGDLLLSTLATNLQIIPHTTGKLKKSEFSVSPLRTTAVHVSTDNKIIVGARDDYPACGPRQVVVMDMKGRHLRVHHYGKNKKPLFTYPYKITTDKENNIYVIDLLSWIGFGRVVVLGPGDAVKGIYTGHPDINDTVHLFIPNDILTTQSHNVLMSDALNNILHILNNDVQCVQYLNTKHSGITCLRSLYIDNRGFLFIGCYSGDNKPNNAKIHMVQLVDSKI